MIFKIIIIFLSILYCVKGQRADRVCATARFSDQCSQLQRGNSGVYCQMVQDSIECAQRIRNGSADFGVFGPESILLLATLRWDGLTSLKEIRHRDRVNDDSEFESVAVIRTTQPAGIHNLRNKKFCHPGLYYDRNERWTERFLKHFERTVIVPQCSNETASAAEIETESFANFFSQACRPGSWSNDPAEDKRLKEKFPQLCELCTSMNSSCDYEEYKDDNGQIISRHAHALKCLDDKGDVAYVSLEEAKKFFVRTPISASKYAYLCPNGSVQEIYNNDKPCVWQRQPWPMIISNDEQAVELSSRLNGWLRGIGSSNWEVAIREILLNENTIVTDTTIQSPKDLMRPYRGVPYEQSLCSTQVKWCTASTIEREKCEVARAAGISTGVYPLIECLKPSGSTVGCLYDVSNGQADFTGIDSNFGFLARYPYNLTSALYAETETEKYASVVVVVRANSTYKRFENLRNAKACFGEFGSIASIAFIQTGKNRGFFDRNQCHYERLLNEFFGPSCTPGALDLAHGRTESMEKLCELCRSSQSTLDNQAQATITIETPPLFHNSNADESMTNSAAPTSNDEKRMNCNADETNSFYGNRGALKCLHETGDVAILELQYLNEHARSLGIDPNEYRIICRNGTLANRNGFDIEQECALTTIVDGEIVVARNNHKTTGIINALISFDKYFQRDPDFKIYNSFAGHRDLLFKDSTLGLVARNEPDLGNHVENYKNLFQNLDECIQSGAYGMFITNSKWIIIISTIVTFIININ